MTTETNDQAAIRIWDELEEGMGLPEYARRLLAYHAERSEPLFPHCKVCGSSAWFCTVCSAQARKASAAPSQDALDAKRLDWLEKNVSAIRDIGWLGGSLRAAIDAAMREEEK